MTFSPQEFLGILGEIYFQNTVIYSYYLLSLANDFNDFDEIFIYKPLLLEVSIFYNSQATLELFNK